MTYYESAESETITLERAMVELDNHGMDRRAKLDFLADLGTKEEYDAQAVLSWLGY